MRAMQTQRHALWKAVEHNLWLAGYVTDDCYSDAVVC